MIEMSSTWAQIDSTNSPAVRSMFLDAQVMQPKHPEIWNESQSNYKRAGRKWKMRGSVRQLYQACVCRERLMHRKGQSRDGPKNEGRDPMAWFIVHCHEAMNMLHSCCLCLSTRLDHAICRVRVGTWYCADLSQSDTIKGRVYPPLPTNEKKAVNHQLDKPTMPLVSSRELKPQCGNFQEIKGELKIYLMCIR